MSAIGKVAVYDPRIVQEEPVYGVQKGACTVSVAPFSAISATGSQHTYQVLVPSLNVFVDRKILWSSTVTGSFSASWAGLCNVDQHQDTNIPAPTSASDVYPDATGALGTGVYPGGTGALAVTASPAMGPSNLNYSYLPMVSPEDITLPMFPLHRMCSNITASINDCTVTTNGDTLTEQILLSSTAENRVQRTTPSRFDTYAWNGNDAMAINGNFDGYETKKEADIPNGSWPLTYLIPSSAQQFASGSTTGSPLSTGVYSVGAQMPLGSVTKPFYYYDSVAKSVITVLEGKPVWRPHLACDAVLTAGQSAGSTVTVGSGVWYGRGADATRWMGGVSSQYVGCRVYGAYVPIGTYITQVTVSAGAVATLTLSQAVTTNTAAGSFNLYFNFGTLLNNTATGGSASTLASVPVSFRFASVEPLILSPFAWQDSVEMSSVGIYGCTNMNFTMNLGVISNASVNVLASASTATGFNQPALSARFQDNVYVTYPNGANLIRPSGIRTLVSSVQLGSGSSTVGTGPFTNPKLLVSFLTPGPDITFPAASNVPYFEFPRYFTTVTGPSGGTSWVVSSQTVTLSSIPDVLAVWVKPNYRGATQGETYVPIQGVNVTFDNFSNLCSNYSQQNLYESSKAAGLDMDYQQFRGFTSTLGNITAPGYTGLPLQTATGVTELTLSSPVLATLKGSSSSGVNYIPSGTIQLTGAPVLLRMGQDITLSAGVAPGCLGNYSVQVNLTLDNQFGFFNAVESATIYVMAVNSGYFETLRGQSAIRKTILNASDVEAAKADSGVTTSQLHRLVGGAHAFGRLSTAIGAIKAAHPSRFSMGKSMPEIVKGGYPSSEMGMGRKRHHHGLDSRME